MFFSIEYNPNSSGGSFDVNMIVSGITKSKYIKINQNFVSN